MQQGAEIFRQRHDKTFNHTPIATTRLHRQGSYTNRTTGATSCTPCEYDVANGFGPKYTSSAGATTCDLCKEGYYMNQDQRCSSCGSMDGSTLGLSASDFVDCPEGSTLTSVRVKPGFYRFTEYSNRIYPCGTNNCQGNITHKGCLIGSAGPLCDLCESGYFLRSASKTCTACEDVREAWSGSFAATLSIILLLVAVLALSVGLIFRRVEHPKITEFYRFYKTNVDEAKQRLVLLFVTMQIILLLIPNHSAVGGSEITGPYATYLQGINIFRLDAFQLLPFDCLSSLDHLDKLCIETTLPLTVLFLVLFFHASPHLVRGRRTEAIERAMMSFTVCLQIVVFFLPLM